MLCKELGNLVSIVELFLLTWKGCFPGLWLTSLWSLKWGGNPVPHSSSPANSHVYRKVQCAPEAQSTWARRPYRDPECFSIWEGNQGIRGSILSVWSKAGRKDTVQILTQTFVATGRIYWPEWQTWPEESLVLCLLRELGCRIWIRGWLTMEVCHSS